MALSLVFLAVLELFRRYEVHLIKREGVNFTAGELIKHNEKFRKEFESQIEQRNQRKLRKDVIIRRINRAKEYPNLSSKNKGISPWFRADLLETYHRGVKIGLAVESLVEVEGGYRKSRTGENNPDEIKAYLVGKIPYEYIESVNFDGDEFYGYPHIFCHFANKGEPYEELVYCIEHDMGHGHTYYSEIAKCVGKSIIKIS
tara:strand:- start:2946 stop:3548 length:603 start_codon:yes stop_codon:yes gene_type:complete